MKDSLPNVSGSDQQEDIQLGTALIAHHEGIAPVA